MGFRLNPKTPEVTKVATLRGFIGLTVVLARRKVTIAIKSIAAPAHARATATDARMSKRTGSGDTRVEASHINTAVTNATSGGGTLSSSQRMASWCGTTLELTGTQWHCAARREIASARRRAMRLSVRIERPVRAQRAHLNVTSSGKN